MLGFFTFGILHLELRIGTPLMQYIAMGAVLSIGLVHILARKMTTPSFDHHEIPQRARNELHAVWMMFIMPGIGIGLLPLLLPMK